MTYANLPPHIRHIAETELTPRQLQILQDRLNGHSIWQIAKALDLDQSTVRYHYRRASQKIARHSKEAEAA